MVAVLEKHIQGRINANDAQLAEVLAQFSPVRVKRNQVLVRQGEVCRWCYFVAEGCVQVFTYDREGTESTRNLVVENNWVTELYSFDNQLPANKNLRAVEPGTLPAISFDSFQQMVRTVAPFEQIYWQIIEQSCVNSVFRLNSFVALDALERMHWMRDYQPKLLTRLSGKLVASYLGISLHRRPGETYSRLKAKL